MARENISMSALTAGLESARRRSTASDRENLMEGRTYIPRMSKEQKALLIAALQAGVKKRREKRAKKIEGTGFESVKEMRKADRAKFREGRKERRQDLKDIRKEEREKKANKRSDNKVSAPPPVTTEQLSSAESSIDSGEIFNPRRGPFYRSNKYDKNNNAKGGKIPTYKKRTSKYRK